MACQSVEEEYRTAMGRRFMMAATSRKVASRLWKSMGSVVVEERRWERVWRARRMHTSAWPFLQEQALGEKIHCVPFLPASSATCPRLSSSAPACATSWGPWSVNTLVGLE